MRNIKSTLLNYSPHAISYGGDLFCKYYSRTVAWRLYALRANLFVFRMWSIKYVPLPLAMRTCPDDPQTFFMQQYHWAMGSATLVMEKEFWRSNISSIHKLCFLNGMLYYMATALVRSFTMYRVINMTRKRQNRVYKTVLVTYWVRLGQPLKCCRMPLFLAWFSSLSRALDWRH